MPSLQGPPITQADYLTHAKTLSGLLHKVSVDDRQDLLQSAMARACTRWDPSRSPWKPWIVLVLKAEVARFHRAWRMTGPLRDDLPGPDLTPHLLSNIDLALLLDHLPPSERLALAAGEGGKTAHRARRRLRQLATQNPKQPRRCSDVS